MGHCQLAQLGLRLARVDERLQRAAVDVVGDRLALEEADGDRVGAGVGGGGGGGFGAHPPQASGAR